ncbi:PucR family transcriptional regulator [Rhizohabitans arisaemae]|uniref:PucR family transcriptional regulator n=1 Tax=Rhizohabitans arisaemae TaxID=2720610 RepID=UPI0024B130B4|nr:PucR family transcriptional regulator [Rhizohabitans arisaemae]
MAPTLLTVVNRTQLNLKVLTGRESLDRAVRWVAVSELEDPTPFLEGGELVLTTGMRMRPRGAKPYMERLVARGVAGLGFGVGLGHDEVPAALVRAAERCGLPLVEVGRATPFIAIGKAVSELLAAEQYEEITKAFAAQGRLTRAALQDEGVGAVVQRLAREIGGWAVLLDETGELRHAAPARAAERVGYLRAELDRLRTPPSASVSVVTPGEHVVMQPLGAGRRVRGFFAVGVGRPMSSATQTVVNAAASLLTLSLERGREQRSAERRLRAALVELLLAGSPDLARDVADQIGGLPIPPVRAIAVSGGDRNGLLEALDERKAFSAVKDGKVIVIVPSEEPAEVKGGTVGAGSSGELEEVPRSYAQALQALASAERGRKPYLRFEDLAGQGLIGMLDRAVVEGFAASTLAPLRGYGSRADLVESLRAYLAHNGHWDSSAQQLGIHRHTMRYRMRRVAELLGRDIDDPSVRAELWIALGVSGG